MMKTANDHIDEISLLKAGDSGSFEVIYNRYAEGLYQYVFRRVKERETSEGIVQEIFLSLWEKRATLHIERSLEGYLFGAAKFRILTHMRSEYLRRDYAAHFTVFVAREFHNSTEEMLDVRDLEQSIDRSIATLPRKCQKAFRLSRVDHVPVAKIAERMNISRRTVENYLSQALKHLRTSLGDFLIVYWLCLPFFF